MIGKVDFQTPEGQNVTLTLNDDGTARCPDAFALAMFDHLMAEYRQTSSPADGPWGTRLLADFAKQVRGKMTFVDRPGPEGEIY